LHSNDLGQKTSSVEGIINALADLEKDIDNVNSKALEMEKRLMVYSDEEIEKLNQQIVTLADNEAKKIVDAAKAEAEREASLIVEEGEKEIARIKKNIDSSFNKAVDTIVKMVLTVNDSSHDDNKNNKNTIEPGKTSENIPKGSTKVPNTANKYPSDRTSKESKIP
jgi:V/A-type H+/Na+-transporting ATPase subunit G/H